MRKPQKEEESVIGLGEGGEEGGEERGSVASFRDDTNDWKPRQLSVQQDSR